MSKTGGGLIIVAQLGSASRSKPSRIIAGKESERGVTSGIQCIETTSGC